MSSRLPPRAGPWPAWAGAGCSGPGGGCCRGRDGLHLVRTIHVRSDLAPWQLQRALQGAWWALPGRLSEAEGAAGKFADGKGARGAVRHWAPLRRRPAWLREGVGSPCPGTWRLGSEGGSSAELFEGDFGCFPDCPQRPPGSTNEDRACPAPPCPSCQPRGPAAVPATRWLHPRGQQPPAWLDR